MKKNIDKIVKTEKKWWNKLLDLLYIFFPKTNWTPRKMSYVAILVATSVVFVMIFMRVIPITAMPSFKIMAGGLPIKITGYIFGPIVGALTGILADLISFAFFPVAIHPFYTLAFALAGFVPGVFGYFFNRRWREYEEVQKQFSQKVNNINFYGTIIILGTVIFSMTIFLLMQPNSTFTNTLISNRYGFISFAIFGSTTMLLAVIIMRFTVKPKTLNMLLPIIAFSAVLELINSPIITLGDLAVLYPNENDRFLDIYTINLFWSPIKIWGNLLVLLIAYRIVSPLIYKKQSNSWENSKGTI